MSGVADIDVSDLIGKPFESQGNGPNAYDCYGLLREMYIRAGKRAPELTTGRSVAENAVLVGQQANFFWAPCERSPGVAVVFQFSQIACHVGFMLNDQTFIHAWEKTGVCIEPLKRWKSRIYGYYDYPE